MTTTIRESSLKLAGLMKNKPQEIERSLIIEGSELLAIFEDTNFGEKFQNLKELKTELLLLAIDDLSTGAQTLKSSQLGLAFQSGKIKTYISPFGSVGVGNVVASISLKNVAAFKNWRSGTETEIPQDHLNIAIYKLIFELSKIV